jgi:hypothetical protein
VTAKKRAAKFLAPQAARKGMGDIVAKTLPGVGNSSERICWRFKHVDNDGPWGLSKLSPDDMAELISKLAQVETQTIKELFFGGEEPGKHYTVENIPTPLAHDRLAALRLGDMTRVSRLRFGGTERLYGFLHDNVFHVIWWDREHEVWPSKKKHT